MIAGVIRYHEAALALLGITAPTDLAAVATLAAIERQLRISLPPRGRDAMVSLR
jgi:hypothetical protein